MAPEPLAGSPAAPVRPGALGVLHVLDKVSVAGSSINGVVRFLSWALPRFEPPWRPEVAVCSPRDPGGAPLEAVGRVAYFGRGKTDPRTLVDLVRHARRTRPALLHLHGYRAWTWGRIASRLLRVPVVLHEHYVDPRVPPAQRMADRCLAAVPAMTVCPTRSVLENVVRQRWIAAADARVIPYGVPLDSFRRPTDAAVARAREELRLPPGVPVVGAVGRIDVQKGLTYLISALPELRARVPDVRLLLVGDGPERPALEALARSLGVAEAVTWAGYRADVPAVLALLDVVAMPSLFEGLPVALLEAMAQGKAVVATPVDGIGEVLEHGRTGWLVPPRSPAPLAEGIALLLADRQRRAALGAAAGEAARRFDVARAVRELEALYAARLAA